MDTRDDGDDRRNGADAHVDRRGDSARAPDGQRVDRPGDAHTGGSPDTDNANTVPNPDRTAGTRDEETDGVGIAEAVGEDRPPLGPLEPGSPAPENVLFVVLGALATVALFATLF